MRKILIWAACLAAFLAMMSSASAFPFTWAMAPDNATPVQLESTATPFVNGGNLTYFAVPPYTVEPGDSFTARAAVELLGSGSQWVAIEFWTFTPSAPPVKLCESWVSGPGLAVAECRGLATSIHLAVVGGAPSMSEVIDWSDWTNVYVSARTRTEQAGGTASLEAVNLTVNKVGPLPDL